MTLGIIPKKKRKWKNVRWRHKSIINCFRISCGVCQMGSAIWWTIQWIVDNIGYHITKCQNKQLNSFKTFNTLTRRIWRIQSFIFKMDFMLFSVYHPYRTAGVAPVSVVSYSNSLLFHVKENKNNQKGKLYDNKNLWLFELYDDEWKRDFKKWFW